MFRKLTLDERLARYHIRKSDDNMCSYELDYSSMYVASMYSRDETGDFENCGFREDVIEKADPIGLGIILSENAHSRTSIDHAPDAAHVLFGLDLVESDIERIVAIDRRGSDEFADLLLEHLLDGGATVIWDGKGELEGAIPPGYITREETELFAYSPVSYTGPVTKKIAHAYGRDIVACAADNCRLSYQCQQKGSAIRGGIGLRSDEATMKSAVAVTSMKRLSFPDGYMGRWAREGADALSARRIEILRAFPEIEVDYELARKLCEIAKVWEAVPRLVNKNVGSHPDSWVKDASILRAARKYGVDHMVNAVLEGVPAEDVVA